MPRIYFAIAIIVITIASVMLFVWPKYQELTILNADITTKEGELRSKNEYFDDIKKVSEELKAYEESLSKISSALPVEPLLPATFNFLQNTASQAGLVLTEVAVGNITMLDGKPVTGDEPEAMRIVKAISLSITMDGSYESLKSFLAEVEQSARIIKIQNIHFEEPEEDEPFSFDLDILVYYY